VVVTDTRKVKGKGQAKDRTLNNVFLGTEVSDNSVGQRSPCLAVYICECD
jgi:hypothetical protein